MIFKFEIAENQRWGGKGLRLKGMEFAEPGGGMVCTHDIMEHFKGDEGDEMGELHALGATLYTRGRKYNELAMRSHTSPAYHLAMEWYNILCYLNEVECRSVSTVFRTVRVKTKELKDEQIEFYINNAVYLMFKNEETIEMQKQMGITRGETIIIKHNIIAGLRAGYLKAKKRYKNSNNAELAHTFYGIEQWLDKQMTHIEEGAQELHIHFTYSDPEAWKGYVVDVYDYDDY